MTDCTTEPLLFASLKRQNIQAVCEERSWRPYAATRSDFQ
jgi:hypothetical protein